MEIVILIAAVVAAVVLLAMSPMNRHHGDATENEARAIAGGADVEHQFKRPPDQGALL